MMTFVAWRLRFAAILALSLFSSNLMAVHSGDGASGNTGRWAVKFSNYKTNMDKFTAWAGKDQEVFTGLENDELTRSLSKSDYSKAAELMKALGEFRGQIADQCKDTASVKLGELMDLCIAKRGIWRGVKNYADNDNKMVMSISELKACRDSIADVFSAKRSKVSSKKSEFTADWDAEKKLKELFNLIMGEKNSFSGELSSEVKEAVSQAETLRDDAKKGFDNTDLPSICKLGSSSRESQEARGGSGGDDAAAKKDAKDNADASGGQSANAKCKPGEKCVDNQASAAGPAAAQAAPAGNAYGSYVPPTGGYGGGGGYGGLANDAFGNGYGQNPFGYGAGGYNRNNNDYTPNYRPAPAYPAEPGYAPPANPIVPPPPPPPPPPIAGGGFGGGYKGGPGGPGGPPPYPPYGGAPGAVPLFTDLSKGVVAGGAAAVETEKVNVRIEKKELKDDKPFPTPMLGQNCGKPVCMPQFGQLAMAGNFGFPRPGMPMFPPQPQRPPYTMLPPSVTPYNPTIPQYPPYQPPTVTPYNPTPYQPTVPFGTPQTGYDQSPPTRYKLPRT